MQKNCKIFQLIVKKRQLPDSEEPEAGILEVCGKVATTAEIDSVAKQLIHHFQDYI